MKTFSSANAVGLLIYLGIGLCVQVFAYDNDLPMRMLFGGDASLSTYAHILVWPLFVLLWLFRVAFWIVMAAIVLCVGIWAYERFVK
jgi:hypothetical protein